jgi:hypothetical protein
VPQIDAVDRFSEIEVDVAEGASAPVGGGLAVLLGVQPTSQMSVHFLSIEPARGTGGGLGGGCKAVPAFTASARQALSTSCVVCHGGANAQANAAVDMSAVNDQTPEGQAAACGQILGRVNLTTPPISGVFLAPDPASGTAHPFKFPTAAAFDAFRTSLLAWIDQEIIQ